MTDTVAITAGAGTTINTDEIGGVHTQRTKLVWGTDGTVTDASATNPLPVTAPPAARSTHSIGAAIQSDSLMNNLTAMTPKFYSGTITASQTDSQIIAAVTSKYLRIVSLVVQCGATATDITFESGTTTRIHKVPAGVNGGQSLAPNPWGWFQTASGAALTVTTGSGSSTEITLTYVEV